MSAVCRSRSSSITRIDKYAILLQEHRFIMELSYRHYVVVTNSKFS